jgi:thiamine-phosphate pyrophosphorylase
VVLYYISDRMQFPGRERDRRERLLERISDAARIGIDFVQLREKDLPAREMESLAREAVKRVRGAGKTRFLINSRTDVALAAGADGVHLRSKDVSPEDVRTIWRESKGAGEPVIAVSCHTPAEVTAAEAAGADFVVFSPVFEKRSSPVAQIAGLEVLRSVCLGKIPVLALGGVTPQNADLCVEARASGIAGIRLFQEGNLAASVARFRNSI